MVGTATQVEHVGPHRQLSSAADNPFANMPSPVVPGHANVLTTVAAQREVAEVQASMMIARMNPRDERSAMDRIIQACTRPTLAEAALYQYARGGTDIQGPSIRLAECIAQQWGNLDFGIRELEQRPGESTVEAYCWDVQHGVRARKIFQVAHERFTREGRTPLRDPRDIYETIANQGARRLRACILSVIPGDVVEAAVVQCERTLKIKTEVTPETLAHMVEMFAEYGVTREAIERRIQRRLEAATPALVVQLGKVYNSLKDGMSKAADWFDLGASQPAPEARQDAPGDPATQPQRTRTAAVKDALAARKRPVAAPAAPPSVSPAQGATPSRGGRQASEALQDVIRLAAQARSEDDLNVARSIAVEQLREEDEVKSAQEHLNEAAQRLAGGT